MSEEDSEEGIEDLMRSLGMHEELTEEDNQRIKEFFINHPEEARAIIDWDEDEISRFLSVEVTHESFF